MAENITIFPTGLTYSRNTKAPLMDKQVFETLALAQAYVDNVDQTAYVGLTVSVTNDSANNGLYYVERIADANNTTGLLVKVGSDSAADVANLQSDVNAIKVTVGDATSGLVASVTKNTSDIATNATEITKKANVFTVGKGLDLTNDVVNLVISPADGNSLSVTDAGLYVAVPEIKVPEYDLVAVETPAAGYASQYQFKKDGQVVNTINIPKDQFLKSASYDDVNKKLIFVFDTTTGENTQEVDIKDLVDTYTAGDYITITDSKISVNYNELCDAIYSDVINPIYLDHIEPANKRIATIETQITVLETASSDYVARIGVLETANGDHESRISVLEGVTHPTLDQVVALENNYNTLNENVTNITTNLAEVKVKDVDTTASNGVALKLANDGKIGVTVNIDTIASAVISQHSIDSKAIALGENIGTEKNPDRYTTSDNVHGVLASINERIESIDADIQSALDGGVTGVEAGNGITVDATVATKPVVGIKIASGSALKANANGLDIVWEELA